MTAFYQRAFEKTQQQNINKNIVLRLEFTYRNLLAMPSNENIYLQVANTVYE